MYAFNVSKFIASYRGVYRWTVHNCTSICGHCVNGKPCQRETGVCDLGCDPGYQTLHCIEGH